MTRLAPKLCESLIVVTAIVCCFLPLRQAQAEELIDDFSAIYKVNQDTSVSISETWRYQLGLLKRNRLEKIIPIKYRSGSSDYQVSFRHWSVIDETGDNIKLRLEKRGHNIHLILESGERPFSGAKIFNVSYQVYNAVKIKGDKAEFNWNVTGNNWNVGIAKSVGQVELPGSYSNDQLSANCLYGATDALAKCFFKIALAGNSSLVSFNSPKTLYPKESLLINLTFPDDQLTPPGVVKGLALLIGDYWPLAAPLLACLIAAWWWLKKISGPMRSGSHSVRFNPPEDLSPLEIGFLYKGSLDLHDLAAEIFYLATKGYLTIELTGSERGADYRLNQHRAANAMMPEHQRVLLDSLFAQRDSLLLSAYLGELPLHAAVLEDKIKDVLRDKDIVRGGAKIRKIIDIIVWLLAAVIGWLAAQRFDLGVLAAVSFATSALIFSLLALLRPARGKRWSEIIGHIRGFERYLSVRESDLRLSNNAPVRNPELYETFLPYALVLGIERLWSAQFEGLVLSSPSWFVNPYWKGQFDPHVLSDDLATLAMVVAGQIPISRN